MYVDPHQRFLLFIVNTMEELFIRIEHYLVRSECIIRPMLQISWYRETLVHEFEAFQVDSRGIPGYSLYESSSSCNV